MLLETLRRMSLENALENVTLRRNGHWHVFPDVHGDTLVNIEDVYEKLRYRQYQIQLEGEHILHNWKRFKMASCGLQPDLFAYVQVLHILTTSSAVVHTKQSLQYVLAKILLAMHDVQDVTHLQMLCTRPTHHQYKRLHGVLSVPVICRSAHCANSA